MRPGDQTAYLLPEKKTKEENLSSVVRGTAASAKPLGQRGKIEERPPYSYTVLGNSVPPVKAWVVFAQHNQPCMHGEGLSVGH